MTDPAPKGHPAIGPLEESVLPEHPRPSPDPEERLQHLAEITDRIEVLEQVPRINRRMRLFLPVFVAAAFGLKAMLGADWIFLLQAAVVIGVALGVSEVLSRKYSEVIRVLEREIRDE